MENIIIIGASGHAKVIIDIIEKEKKYNIIGLIDEFKETGETILDYKIIGKEKDLPFLIKKHSLVGGVIAIGDNWIRSKVCGKIKLIEPSFEFVSTIHPSVQIGKNVKIGAGTVIMPGVIINACSLVGTHCILNTNSSLDHDSEMGDFSSLAPNVSTGGNVRIGDFSAISIGATIIHGITIKEQTVIGAGSVVLKNIQDFSVAYGVPASVVKKRKAGEKYL
jgi:sugar O-acyltransferase (sialic acid O-acetyltransferase NeuD family)